MATTFTLDTSALPDSRRVVAFRGVEEIGSPYVFEIWVVVEGQDDTELADAVGSKAKLLLTEGMFLQGSFAGVLVSVDLLRAMENVSLYRVVLAPSLWQLNHTRHSRLFTKTSVDEVIKQVLDLEGITDYEFRLKSSYEKEEHICQYQESSLDFIHRWMEREGLYYFFEQTDDREKLIIADDKSAHVKSREAAVPYFPSRGDWSSGPHFREFMAKQAVMPLRVQLKDYDYANPSLNVEGGATVSDSGQGQLNFMNDRFWSPSEGDRLAVIRADALRAKSTYFHARGPVLGISSGFKFSLDRHAKEVFNIEYVAVGVEHVGLVDGVSPEWAEAIPFEAKDVYTVTVRAISAKTQYRLPVRTAWPRIDGFESGVVDGEASSEYAQIDDQGRYLVRFRFDESSLKGGQASTYVRMMQPHAGAIEGWHFPLRKGTEVTFLFLGGDPDRPVIAGAIPNAVTPSPVTSGNHTRNVIQTGGRNRFELEDLAGQQRVTLSTPHANTYLRMGFANEDHELIVKTDLRGLWCSGNNTDFNIKGHWWIEVDKDKKEHITGAVEEKYKAKKEETVTGPVTETYNNGHKTTVNAALREEYSNAGKRVVTEGGHEEIISSQHDLTVHGPANITTDGKVTWNVEKALWELNAMNYSLNASAFNRTDSGSSHDTVQGFKSELVLGMKNDMLMGVHTEVKVAGCLSLFGGVAFEYALGKQRGTVWEVSMWAIKNETAAAENRLKAMENDISSMKNDAAAMENRALSMTLQMGGMSSEIEGLKNTQGALINYVSGLTVQG
jgi:type VI secretion system secreted protein VgrG